MWRRSPSNQTAYQLGMAIGFLILVTVGAAVARVLLWVLGSFF